jgi:hypothetical protein
MVSKRPVFAPFSRDLHRQTPKNADAFEGVTIRRERLVANESTDSPHETCPLVSPYVPLRELRWFGPDRPLALVDRAVTMNEVSAFAAVLLISRTQLVLNRAIPALDCGVSLRVIDRAGATNIMDLATSPCTSPGISSIGSG